MSVTSMFKLNGILRPRMQISVKNSVYTQAQAVPTHKQTDAYSDQNKKKKVVSRLVIR